MRLQFLALKMKKVELYRKKLCFENVDWLSIQSGGMLELKNVLRLK